MHIVNMKKWKWVRHIWVIVLLFSVYCLNFNNITNLSIFNDEFGYWGGAATISGLHWNDTLALTPNYNMGYSILLVPLLWIFKDSMRTYQAAIMLNMILLLIAYFCAVYIYNCIFDKKKYDTMIAGVSVFSGCVLTQAQIAWSETLLTMIYWAIIAVFISLIKKPLLWKELLLLLLAGYLPIIHTRALFSSVVIIIILFIYEFRKKNVLRLLLVFFSSIVLLYLYKVTQKYQSDIIFQASSFSNYNSLDFTGGSIRKQLAHYIDNIKPILYSVITKFYSLSVMMLGTFFILVKGIFVRCKNKDKYMHVYILVVFNLVLMLILTSVRMFSLERADLVVYTRYLEYTVGPASLFALGLLLTQEVEIKGVLWNLLLCAILSKFVFKYLSTAKGPFNVCCSPLIGAFVEYAKGKGLYDTLYLRAMWYSLVVVGIYVIAFLCIRNNKICFLCLITCVNIWVYRYANIQTNYYRDDYNKIVNPVIEIIEDLDLNKIYYLYDDKEYDYTRYIKSLQAKKPQLDIEILDINENVEGYFLSNNSKISEEKIYGSYGLYMYGP